MKSDIKKMLILLLLMDNLSSEGIQLVTPAHVYWNKFFWPQWEKVYLILLKVGVPWKKNAVGLGDGRFGGDVVVVR